MRYPQVKLTARQVDTSKAKDKPYKLSDGGGLYLLVNPNGARYWRLKYRVTGKEKSLALVYTLTSRWPMHVKNEQRLKKYWLLVVTRGRKSRKKNMLGRWPYQTALRDWRWNGMNINR